MRSVERVVIELDGGLPVVLQRVPADHTAESWRGHLRALGHPARVVDDFFDGDPTLAVIDGRAWTDAQMEALEIHRNEIGARRRVVLLDAASTRRLLRLAPHFSSWTGGVAVPSEKIVKVVSDPEAQRIGRQRIEAWLRENHASPSNFAGTTLAYDFVSGDVLTGRTGLQIQQDLENSRDYANIHLETMRSR